MDTTTPSPNLSPNTAPTRESGRFVKGIELRYLLTMELFDTGPSTVRQLIAALHRRGFRIPGRASKTISDALRWEERRDRVRRIGRARYRAGTMPRGTEYRICARVEQMRAEAEELLSLARRAALPQRHNVAPWAGEADEASWGGPTG